MPRTDGATQPTFPPERTHRSGSRLVAHWIDGILILVLAILPGVAVGALAGADPLDWPLGLTATVLYVPYFVVTQSAAGRSPGKAALGLRVVDAEGSVPSRGALVRRSVPLIFEWIGIIALVGMLSSAYRQRLGDRWARTYVVGDE
ncbi:MAG: RDD family protein [Actinomycetota bacterium]|nr:RDD family protein [Actinomycetota bacterium]